MGKKHLKISVILYDKPAFIISKLPPKYRSIVIGSLISKAVEYGSFFKELEPFLSYDDINELKEIFKENNIYVGSRKTEKESKSKDLNELLFMKEKEKRERKKIDETKIKKDSLDAFIGFDD